MKLTITMMTVGLAFLCGTSNVHAAGFLTDDAQQLESKQTPAAIRSPIETSAVDTAPVFGDGKGQKEIVCNRSAENTSHRKASLDRVDLSIKRSRHGIHVTFAPQKDHQINDDHRSRVKSTRGGFDVPSRICSLTDDSIERTSLKKKERSTSGKVSRTKHDDLFHGKWTHVPGLTSLALATMDLIGLVIGCYRQRQSFVV
ncbi:MAG: hypothetical protein WCH39_16560 [Schlesneria sp.]